MTYQTAFPDFDPATLPTMPGGFVDVSWRQDACPRFDNATLGLRLWVDYADAALRDVPQGFRFTLCATSEKLGDTIAESDSFKTIAANILALDFMNACGRTFSPAELIIIRRRNAAYVAKGHKGTCATHDACDANLIMAESFEYVTGQEIEATNPDHARLWSEAWTLAHSFGLSA